jgi:TIR domain
MACPRGRAHITTARRPSRGKVDAGLAVELGAPQTFCYNAMEKVEENRCRRSRMSGNPQTPKVFISYSWTNDGHVDWVVRLAERLVSDGVDVVLDQWDLKEGHDKYAFMERMVTDPSVGRVLAICDEMYADKADGRRGGVGTETQIISKDIYEKVSQEKFIPVIRERDGEGKEFVPVFLRNRKYIDFSNDDAFGESYEKLLRVIFGRPERKKPQLGQPPAHLFAEDGTHVKTASKLDRLKDSVQRQRPHVQAVLQEYLDLFAESMEDFRITYDRGSDPPFDEQVLASIKAFLPYRDNFVDFLWFAANYMNDTETYDRVFSFLETVIPYKSRPDKLNSWSEASFDNYRFILYELFLYLIACLIKTKRYSAAVRFIDAEYHHTDTLGGTGYRKEGVSVFNEPVESLDQWRNQRLRLNRYSVVADLVVERSIHPKISFADLFQADFLLFLRGFLPGSGARSLWYPRCAGYSSRVGTLEVFARATSPRGFDAARLLFGAKDLADLYAKLRVVFKDPHFSQIMQSERFWRISLPDLLNIHNIEAQLQPNP